MNFFKRILAVALLSVTLKTVAQTTAADTKMNAFITSLMGRMTVDEKIGQLNLPSVGIDITGPIVSQGVDEKIRSGQVGGVFNTYGAANVRKLQDLAMQSRLKIPLFFGFDVIHGHRTIFPQPLGLAATWDMITIEQTARAAADEASADGLNWTYSPMVDIARDPRWGRVSEGNGEDPYLGSQIGKAMVRGYQGTGFAPNSVMACVKHFALYGAAEAGRDYNTTDMSLQRMYNEYLPPYKAAIDAGAASVMSSFNDINGIPATVNKWLLTDLLRKQWGFKGFVATDYTAINETIQHGMGNLQEVSALALKAGVDQDMVGEGFLTTLKKSLAEKKITMADLDAACRRILEAKYKIGLFTDAYKFIDESRSATAIRSADKLELARIAAQKSFVLLKNKGNILPLKGDKRMLFVGPLVNSRRDLLGNWNGAGKAEETGTIWEALQKRFPGNAIQYAKGCNLIDEPSLLKKINPHGAGIQPDALSPQGLIDSAVAAAGSAEVVIAFLGESAVMSGEAASRSMIGLPENQVALLKALKRAGKPVILVLMNGRPLTLPWEDGNMDAILETWFPGSMGGEAIINTLFGVSNPTGKLTMSFPQNVGQIPVYYNAKNTGRPFDEEQKYTSKYLDVPNAPLYPFGYGLSYTSYTYSDISLDKNTLAAGGLIKARITVTNAGAYDGEETVQLYIRDMVGSTSRPVKELKGFQKVALKKGESKEISFSISLSDLKFFNYDLKWVSEPGEFRVFIGGNSRDVKEASFTLIK